MKSEELCLDNGISLSESGMSLSESGMSLSESGMSLSESGISLSEGGTSLSNKKERSHEKNDAKKNVCSPHGRGPRLSLSDFRFFKGGPPLPLPPDGTLT